MAIFTFFPPIVASHWYAFSERRLVIILSPRIDNRDPPLQIDQAHPQMVDINCKMHSLGWFENITMIHAIYIDQLLQIISLFFALWVYSIYLLFKLCLNQSRNLQISFILQSKHSSIISNICGWLGVERDKANLRASTRLPTEAKSARLTKTPLTSIQLLTQAVVSALHVLSLT